MLTAPLEKESKESFLAQGLPSSPILAYLCYKSLFDYIDDLSKKNNIVFTLYVDDMTFSSNAPIAQDFINKIIGLMKSKKNNNNLKINKRKTHYYKKETRKKVTGVYISEGVPTISSKKHFEIFVLYNKLINILHDELNDIDGYFDFYNLFLKFSGNLIHLFQVEHGRKLEPTTGNSAHNKMVFFYKTLSRYVKPGLIKKNKDKKYSKENVLEEGFKIAQTSFLELKKNISHFQKNFPKLKRNILNT